MLNKLVSSLLVFCLAQPAFADDDEGFFGLFSQGSSVVPQNALYQENCASCHLGYQPGLLPSASWEKMMVPKALADHFGDNAELDEQDRKEILVYLGTYAADKGKRLLRYGKGEAPLRISELRYFIHEHDELSKRMVQGNPQVKSWSNCLACHTDAEEGSYKERNIKIPSYGFWED